MQIDRRKVLALSVLLPEEKYLGWVPYEEIVDTFFQRVGRSNLYRNPDRTLAQLIHEEARSG